MDGLGYQPKLNGNMHVGPVKKRGFFLGEINGNLMMNFVEMCGLENFQRKIQV